MVVTPCGPLQFSLQNSIYASNSTWSMVGPYRGSISLTTEADQAAALLCQPITLDAIVTASQCDDGIDACFEGSFNIVTGIVNSIGDEKRIDGTFASLKIVDYFERLRRKVINTENFEGDDIATILAALAGVYGGVPVGLYNFNIGHDTLIRGPVDGNSTWEELYKIAEAGRSELFVQVGGVLTADPWVQCTCNGQLLSQCDVINSATKVKTANPPFTVLRVRGAFQTEFDCDLDLTTIPNDLNEITTSGGFQGCILAAQNTKQTTVCANNLKGSKEDLIQAIYTSAELTILEFAEDPKDGSVALRVQRADGFNFLEGVPFPFTLQITGRVKPTSEFGFSDTQLKNYKNSNSSIDLPYALGLGYGWGYGFGKSNSGASQTNDESTQNQIEIVVVDEALLAKFGVIEGVYENKYVTCKNDLFHLGIRQFQKWRMEQNLWELDLGAITPPAELNQCVEFLAPTTELCDGTLAPSETKTGVINYIQTNQDHQSGKATMRLGVWALDDQCETSYTSSNLINLHCISDEDNNSWERGVSGVSDGYANIEGNCGRLHVTNAGFSFLTLCQGCMDVGEDYTIYFEMIPLIGTPLVSLSIVFEIYDAVTLLPVLSTSVGLSGLAETHSIVFQPTNENMCIKWRLNGVPPNETAWSLCNINLTTTQLG